MLATVPHCAFDVERGPDWLLVRVRDIDADAPLAESVWRLMQQHFAHRVVLELDGVELLTGDLVDELAQLHQRIEEHDGVMRLCGLSPLNRRVLHNCGLDERLLPYGDREEAILGRSHVPR